jgi:hypothetical protein
MRAIGVVRWMPTDQVRGLKAHGSSPAMTVEIDRTARISLDRSGIALEGREIAGVERCEMS